MKRIIISRTDNIGDVVLTLPLAGWLKQNVPDCQIVFLARGYVKDVVEHCDAVDEFIDWETLQSQPLTTMAKQLSADVMLHVFPNATIAKAAQLAGIATRIGSNRRWYHWRYCNRLVNLSRKHSSLHEAQLNCQLLKPFGYTKPLSLNELNEQTHITLPPAAEKITQLISSDKLSVIIHPGTNGHTREWSDQNFKQLINQLPKDRVQVIVTGTERERAQFQSTILDGVDTITDTMGQLNLLEFMQLIQASDVLLAGSTGPVHLAGILNKPTIGLYPPCRGMNPQRWAPLGQHVVCLVGQPKCGSCQSIKSACMEGIRVDDVSQLICRVAHG